MGRVGDAQDPHARRRAGPKLTVTGRLHGTADRRPVEIEADGRDLLIRVPGLRAAWSVRRSVSVSTAPFLRAVRSEGVCVRLRIGRFLTMQVLPNPSIVLRCLVPGLRFARPGLPPG